MKLNGAQISLYFEMALFLVRLGIGLVALHLGNSSIPLQP